MKTIPIHKLSVNSRVTDFEIEIWANTVSSAEALLPHRHNYFEVLFFVEGEAKHEIDFIEYDFKAYSVHFVSAQSVHLVKRQPGSRGFSMMFSPAFLPADILAQSLEFYKPGSTPILNLQKTGYKTLTHLIELITEEYNNGFSMKREVLQSLFYVLLLKLQRLYVQATGKKRVEAVKDDFVTRLELLIEQNYTNHWRVNDYARALNLSVGNLSALCRKHFSLSAQQLIHQRLLIQIKRLLAYSNKTVKEICFELNFEDPAYFNRFFRKYTGVTPLAYRKALKH